MQITHHLVVEIVDAAAGSTLVVDVVVDAVNTCLDH